MQSEDTVKFNEDLVRELNFLRINPQAYSNNLRKYANMFKGKVLYLPSGEKIMTSEGAKAYEAAALYLDNLNAVPALIESKALTAAAQDYLNEVKHLNPDKIGEIQLENILEKRGEFMGHFAQTMDFGSNYPELVVVNLLADDGDEQRQNRANLLNPKFKHVGLAKGTHKEFKHCTVIFYAQEFIGKEGAQVEKKQSSEGNDVSEITKKLKDAMRAKKEAAAIKEKEVVKETTSKTVISSNSEEEEDFDVPEGYTKVHKEEKVVVEGGVKKKVIKVTKYREDGTKETEITKEKI